VWVSRTKKVGVKDECDAKSRREGGREPEAAMLAYRVRSSRGRFSAGRDPETGMRQLQAGCKWGVGGVGGSLWSAQQALATTVDSESRWMKKTGMQMQERNWSGRAGRVISWRGASARRECVKGALGASDKIEPSSRDSWRSVSSGANARDETRRFGAKWCV